MTSSGKAPTVPYMPDGRPVPLFLTLEELILLLRIRVRFPEKTIERMRHRGLKGVQVSKRVLFRLDNVLEFMDMEQERNPR